MIILDQGDFHLQVLPDIDFITLSSGTLKKKILDNCHPC